MSSFILFKAFVTVQEPYAGKIAIAQNILCTPHPRNPIKPSKLATASSLKSDFATMAPKYLKTKHHLIIPNN